MSFVQLNADLSRALGLPKYTRKAVLTLEVGKLPTIKLEVFATDGKGGLLVEEVREYGEPVDRRIAHVRFMVRLEPMS